MATLSTAEKSFLKHLVNPVRRPLNLAWCLTVISSLLLVWQAWLLAKLFSTWLTNYFNAIPLPTNVSSYWFIGMGLCFMLRPLLNSGRELLSARASLQVRSELRTALLTTMAKLGPNLRHFGSDGSLSSQIIDQTDALDGFISRFSVQKKVTVSTPFILLIAVAWQSKFAAALLFMTAPLVPIFMILIGQLTARKSAEQFSALSQLSGRFLDWIRGMPTLKRLQATHIAEQDLANSSEAYRRRTMDVLKIAFLNGAVLELLAALSIALVAVYLGFGLMGILPWDKGHVPVSYFGALFILLLAPEFYAPLRQLGADYHAKAQAEGAVHSLLPMIEAGKQAEATVSVPVALASNIINIDTTTPSVLNNIDAQRSDCQNTDIERTNPKSLKNSKNLKNNDTDLKSLLNSSNLAKPFGLSVMNLSIKAPLVLPIADRQKPDSLAANEQTLNANADQSSTVVLTDKTTYRTRLAPISFDIKAAQRIALIGDSGSGKSSLLQAIMGFVDYEGMIMLTRADHPTPVALGDIAKSELRQHIGYLAQQVALMPLTIAENLRLANPQATDEQLISVLEEVELWPLIKRLPAGLHTQLGERGQGLSGGQQQRLCIAQLLLRKDSLWLLDEPTEHLDPDTAQHLHQLLERVSRGKTVIWITHAHEPLTWLDKVIKLTPPNVNNMGDVR